MRLNIDFNKLLTIFLLISLTPIGIYLMYKKEYWSIRIRNGITVLYIVIVISTLTT